MSFSKQTVINLQKDLGVTPDGDWGPISDAAFHAALAMLGAGPSHDGKPVWIANLEARIGWTETGAHAKEIAGDWPLVGLNYASVSGKTRPWCGLAMAIAMHQAGLSIPSGAAAAANWSSYGVACGFVCGAILPIKHAHGGHHVTCFLYWIDEKNKIAACLGGNQSNSYRISSYNLSGNAHGHDEVIGGTPRWPRGVAQTNYVYSKTGTVSDGSNESTL